MADDSLAKMIATLTLKIGRRINANNSNERNTILNSALILLNQAQILSKSSPVPSRKLINQARRLSNVRD